MGSRYFDDEGRVRSAWRDDRRYPYMTLRYVGTTEPMKLADGRVVRCRRYMIGPFGNGGEGRPKGPGYPGIRKDRSKWSSTWTGGSDDD